MSHQSTQFNFNDSRKPAKDFLLYEKIIEDCGSRYSVGIGRVAGKEDIKAFLKTLKSKKKYIKATHNSWAARITHDEAIYETKSDDREAGAGMVILRVMQKENITDCIICVTRWFGGVKLQGDRFKHLQTATHHAITHTFSK